MILIFYNLDVNDSSLKYCLNKYYGVTHLDFLNQILIPLNEKNKELHLKDLSFDKLIELDLLLENIKSYNDLKKHIEDIIKEEQSQYTYTSQHIKNSEFIKAVYDRLGKLENIKRPFMSIFSDGDIDK